MADTAFTRVSFRYRSYDRKWWEVFGNSNTNFAQIASTLENIVAKAVAFRHASVYVSHVRISNPFAQRQSQILHISNPGRTIGSSVPETTANAAIYEFAGTDAGVKRHIWLRGLKEADVRRLPGTGQDVQANDLSTLIAAYYESLRAATFGIPNVQPVDTTGNKRHAIDSITVLPLERVKCNVSEAFVTGDRKRMILYKIDQKLFPGLRGRFTVTSDATGFIPQGYLTPLPEGTYPLQAAAFRKEEYRFTPFRANTLTDTGATFLGFDRRDTAGGPLDTRGRGRPVIRRSR